MLSNLLKNATTATKEPISIEERFCEFIKWAEEEGMSVVIHSFIANNFNKPRTEDLTNKEKEITFEHLRDAVMEIRRIRLNARKTNEHQYH